jgi:hypothetical protein
MVKVFATKPEALKYSSPAGGWRLREPFDKLRVA